MRWILALLLGQGADFRVEDLGGREVRLTAEVRRTGEAPLVFLSRRVARMRAGNSGQQWISEGWREESLSLAEASRDLWTAEVRAALRPGWYRFQMGPSEIRVAVSRSEFKAWERELEELRAIAGNVIRIARQIDTEATTAQAFQKCARELDREREKVLKLKTDFEAGEDALLDGIDRLRFHRIMLKYTKFKGAEVEDYGPPEPGEKEGPPNALEQVETLPEFIAREVTLKLVDEILLLASDEEQSRKIIRWEGKNKAFETIVAACEKHRGSEDLAALLKMLPNDEEKSSWERFVKSVSALRARLVH